MIVFSYIKIDLTGRVTCILSSFVGFQDVGCCCVNASAWLKVDNSHKMVNSTYYYLVYKCRLHGDNESRHLHLLAITRILESLHLRLV